MNNPIQRLCYIISYRIICIWKVANTAFCNPLTFILQQKSSKYILMYHVLVINNNRSAKHLSELKIKYTFTDEWIFLYLRRWRSSYVMLHAVMPTYTHFNEMIHANIHQSKVILAHNCHPSCLLCRKLPEWHTVYTFTRQAYWKQ